MSYQKYHSEKTIVDGIEFDSRLEAERYIQLKLLKQAGEINHLSLQEEFQITRGWTNPETGEKTRSRFYRADFCYFDLKAQKWIAEDTKGVETADFKLKWTLVRKQYPDYEFRKLTRSDV